jgi:hypothetical protein
LLALKNSQSRLADGCQTVMWASDPAAGAALDGIGTALNASWSDVAHAPASSVTRTFSARTTR